MGRRLNEVGDELKMVPYKVVAKGDNVAVMAQGKEYTAPEISAMILQKLKKAAEDYLGQSVTEACLLYTSGLDFSCEHEVAVAEVL